MTGHRNTPAEVLDLPVTLPVAMRLVLYGHLLSKAVSAFARLGLAEALRDGCRTADELAGEVGANAEMLRRLLLALAAFDVVGRAGDDVFKLTEFGATLLPDAHGSALPTALLVSAEVGQAWDGLLETVRSGEPAFPSRFAASFFDYLDRRPDLRTTFDESQAAGLALDLEQMAEAIAQADPLHFVDIGGGDAALLTHLLGADRRRVGTLVELPAEVAAAERRLTRAGVRQRCTIAPGDFFGVLPDDGDVYVVRHVLHDWDDVQCRRLLQNLRRWMPSRARVAVIEGVRPAPLDGDQSRRFMALMDLYMMTLFGGGRERSADEYCALLREAGFRVENETRLPTGGLVLLGGPDG